MGGTESTSPGWRQRNTAKNGSVYATMTGDITVNSTSQAKRGLRLDTKVLLAALPANVIFFFYGMLSYTGRNSTVETWRAVLFLVLFLTTLGMLGRWIRRRI